MSRLNPPCPCNRGAAAESWVADRLLQTGNPILARNFKVRGAEIDLIFQSAGYLVFVEVKLRASLERATEAIRPCQQRRIRRAAHVWLAKHPSHLQPRFDTVSLVPDCSGYRTQWIRNAF